MRTKQRGSTLIDALMAITVLSIFSGYILSAANQSSEAAAAAMSDQVSMAAFGLADEVASKSFSGPCWAGAKGTAYRQSYICIDDYNGYASSGIYTREGSLIPRTSDYSVSVTVDSSAAVSLGSISNAGGVKVKKIVVTVSTPNGRQVIARRYRSDHA